MAKRAEKKSLKVVALLSGGIDSAAAVGLALEQGLDVVALHYCTVPFADERSEKKARDVAEHLEKRFGRKIKLVIVPFGKVLAEIAKNCERKFNCVLCRRMMLRIAEKLAKEEGASALLSGESLGQVASQTLPNLSAEAGAAKIPIIRPLLGMDKLEIEAIAKRMGTFEISILPSSCCSIPEKPSTAAKKAVIEEFEKKLPVQRLVLEAFNARKEGGN
ncbi:MAG: asparagine synthase-related protein [archaeon]